MTKQEEIANLIVKALGELEQIPVELSEKPHTTMMEALSLVKNLDIQRVSVSLPPFDKGRTLMEAHNYADAVVRKTLFGKSKELAKQRIVSMYLLDEMEKGNER